MAAFTSAPGLAVPGRIWPDSPDSGNVTAVATDVSGTTLDSATVIIELLPAADASNLTGDNAGVAVPGSDASVAPAADNAGIAVPGADVSALTNDVAGIAVPGADASVAPAADTALITPATNAGADASGLTADSGSIRLGDNDASALTADTALITPATNAAADASSLTADVGSVRVPGTDASALTADNAAVAVLVTGADVSGLSADLAGVAVPGSDASGQALDDILNRIVSSPDVSGLTADLGAVDEGGADFSGLTIDSASIRVVDNDASGLTVDTSPAVIVVVFATDGWQGLEGVPNVAFTDADFSGAGKDVAHVGTVGISDAHLRVYLIDADPEVDLDGDPDSRSWTADADPPLHLGDGVVGAGSNRTVLCEVEQFVNA